MKNQPWAFALCALFFVGNACADPVQTQNCYKNAETRIEEQRCLQMELSDVKDEYADVVERVLTEARSLDRAQRTKSVAKAFQDANKSFQDYMKDECDWVAASLGAGTGAGNATLACRINLMRVRQGSLEVQFLNGKN